jgi:hypothetical protein
MCPIQYLVSLQGHILTQLYINGNRASTSSILSSGTIYSVGGLRDTDVLKEHNAFIFIGCGVHDQCSFETLQYVNPATQHNTPEDQNPQH